MHRQIQDLTPEALEYERVDGSEDIAFFAEIVLRRGGPVLDLGCGTGRFSIPLAQGGLEVVGLDISGNMLQAFGRRLQAYGPEIRNRIRLIRADMRRFSLRQKFACAVCSSNTLLLSGDESAVEKTLLRTAEHLQSGGVLVLDVAAIDEEIISALARYPAEEAPDVTFELAGGRQLVRKHRIELLPAQSSGGVKKVAVTYIYYDGAVVFGKRKEELVLLSPERLLSLIERSGLSVCDTFGWYDHRPYTENERKLLLVAEKRE